MIIFWFLWSCFVSLCPCTRLFVYVLDSAMVLLCFVSIIIPNAIPDISAFLVFAVSLLVLD